MSWSKFSIEFGTYNYVFYAIIINTQIFSTINMFCNYWVVFYNEHNLLSFIVSRMKTHLKTPVAVGLALGIYFGIGLLIFALTALRFGYCKIFVSFMSTFYIGYHATLLWAFLWLLRWFVDGFIGWFIVTRLVGYFQKRMK